MSVLDQSGTRVTSSTIQTTPWTDPNPFVTVDQDLYRTRPTGREDTTPGGSIKTLLCRAGEKMRQSEVDALFPAAEVSAVEPNSGPAAGGTVVTLRGRHLDGVTAVNFGGAAGTALTIESNFEATVTTPAGVAGAVDVTLTDDQGTTTLTGGFTYE